MKRIVGVLSAAMALFGGSASMHAASSPFLITGAAHLTDGLSVSVRASLVAGKAAGSYAFFEPNGKMVQGTVVCVDSSSATDAVVVAQVTHTSDENYLTNSYVFGEFLTKPGAGIAFVQTGAVVSFRPNGDGTCAIGGGADYWAPIAHGVIIRR
jgi:hypothetical protein